MHLSVSVRLYYLYRRTPRRWRELKAVAKILKSNVVKPSRAQGTRWIDHRRKELHCLATNYQFVATQLEEQASGQWRDVPPADAAKMKGYLKLLKSCKFVLPMALYQDLVDDITEVSLEFQRDDLPLSSVRTSVVLAEASLRRKRTTPGSHLQGSKFTLFHYPENSKIMNRTPSCLGSLFRMDSAKSDS
ncbi:putative zinc finger protein [Apostichopus japonicus]|uniref:Putative zinc finger protein n=1 Tax=Stichopus japonicus TaxID=307972 RepID=A0A2G8LK88_STIJA|nr:putative zinc finger protein [Apostichopus japonicus]